MQASSAILRSTLFAFTALAVAASVSAQQSKPAQSKPAQSKPTRQARPPAKAPQPPAPKPAPEAVTPPAPPPPPDVVVKVQHVAGENTTTSTIAGNGKRQRIEFGGEMTVITQCDAGVIVQINEWQKRFLTKPLKRVQDAAQAQTQSAATKGGLVTFTTTVVDTGERKEMFGSTARHLKTTLSQEPDANACDKRKDVVETDGWFVDMPPALTCSTAERQAFVVTADCRDEVKYVHAGVSPVGYPLAYTVTTAGGDGKPSVMTMAVTAWDRQTLPDALFSAPEGYTEVKTLAQLTADAPSGIPRIGVMRLTSKVKDAIALEALSEALVISLDEAGVDAVLLDASSPAAALTEATEKSCDYVLVSQVVDLNKPAKGVLSRVTGSKEYGARVEYVLTTPGETKPRLSRSERSGTSTLQTAVTTTRNVSRYMTPFGLLSSQFNFMSTFSTLNGGAAGSPMTQSSDPVLNTVFSLIGPAPAEKPVGELLQTEDAAVAAALEKEVAAIASELLKK